jgi:hypothetical protein
MGGRSGKPLAHRVAIGCIVNLGWLTKLRNAKQGAGWHRGLSFRLQWKAQCRDALHFMQVPPANESDKS